MPGYELIDSDERAAVNVFDPGGVCFLRMALISYEMVDIEFEFEQKLLKN